MTANLTDFPAVIIATLEIKAQHSDEFVAYLLNLAPAAVCGVVRKQ